MGRIEPESFGLSLPSFADVFVGGQPSQCFESAAEVVGTDEAFEMVLKLFVAVVVISLDGCFFNGAVHSLDLTVCPGVLDFGQPVFDTVLLAAHVEHVRHIPGCGDCTDIIVHEIDAAHRQVLVQAYGFTSAQIADALVKAKRRGVDVRAVLDKSQRTERIPPPRTAYRSGSCRGVI